MKKLIALSVIAVSAYGVVYAKMDWQSPADIIKKAEQAEKGLRSVTHAAKSAQLNEELRIQAQKSARQIMEAVNDFAALAMKKIAPELDVGAKEYLQETVAQLEKLLAIYKAEFEKGDEDLSNSPEQLEIEQNVGMRCMLLRALLAENIDEAMAIIVSLEIFTGLQKTVAQINTDLK